MMTTKRKTLDSRLVFVVAYGSDCDGCNSGWITVYGSPRIAAYYAKISNLWSDGLRYVPVNEEKAIEYARGFGKRLKQMLS